MFPWDAGDFFYPNLAYVHEELRHFRLPLWLPYAFAGFPIIADPEGQIFYPPNWLMVLVHGFAPLPFRLVEIQIVLHYFLAGLFMFHLARDFTRDTVSAVFGGILYMFSGAMVAHAQHLAIINANAWFPLVFLLARRGLIGNQWASTLGAGVFFGVEVLTGHMQHAVLLGLLLFLYFAYEACAGRHRAEMWPRWIWQLAVIATTGAGLAMVQLLPTAELNPLSIRTQITEWDVTQGNHPAYLLTLFLPNYFGGINGVPYLRSVDPTFHYAFLSIPGFVLALMGLIEMARQRNFFWLGLISLGSLVAMGKLGYLVHLLAHIPILNLFRHAPMYFDLANFGLCLMSAVGMRALWNQTGPGYYRKVLPPVLIGLLLQAMVLGIAFQAVGQVPGWPHMLVVLSLVGGLFAAMLHGPLLPRLSQYAVIGLTVFELCFYGMNQVFNASPEDPKKTLAHDFVAGRTQTLQLLRSDPEHDFRVAGFGESEWGNGWSVWRIPGIYGGNPIMLRRYQEYVRQFTHSAGYAVPYAEPGQPDHWLDSPMLDLLGVKYLVVTRRVEGEQRLAESSRFEKVFSDLDWWKTYRNKEYLPGIWFFPGAWVLPDTGSELALMNSQWFDPRQSLLIARQSLDERSLPQARPLEAISIHADQADALSAGQVVRDADCAEVRSKLAYWSGKGNWVRFDVKGVKEAGRYLLSLEYSTTEANPSLSVELTQGNRKQVSGPVKLPRGWDWTCKHTRSIELGVFELTPGSGQVLLTQAGDVGLDVFYLQLVSLQECNSPKPESFLYYQVNII